MSGYGVFAEYYDRLTENVEYKKRADYFRTLLSAQGVTGGTLLDLACGTGRLLIEVAAFGFDVIGGWVASSSSVRSRLDPTSPISVAVS